MPFLYALLRWLLWARHWWTVLVMPFLYALLRCLFVSALLVDCFGDAFFVRAIEMPFCERASGGLFWWCLFCTRYWDAFLWASYWWTVLVMPFFCTRFWDAFLWARYWWTVLVMPFFVRAIEMIVVSALLVDCFGDAFFVRAIEMTYCERAISGLFWWCLFLYALLRCLFVSALLVDCFGDAFFCTRYWDDCCERAISGLFWWCLFCTRYWDDLLWARYWWTVLVMPCSQAQHANGGYINPLTTGSDYIFECKYVLVAH